MSGELTLGAACESHAIEAEELEDWLAEFRRLALLEFDAQLKQSLLRQGASAAAESSAKFTGTLDDISVGDMIQTVQIAAKDAIITVSAGTTDSRIWCCAGEIVDAESGPLRGEAALYRILGFEHGHMLAELRSARRARTINEPTHRLLLEGVRRKDELARMYGELGDDARYYQAAPFDDAAELSETERALLPLFSQPRCLRDVIAVSELGDWETAQALLRSIEAGRLLHIPGAVGASSVAAVALPTERTSALSYLPLSIGKSPRRKPSLGWLWGAVAAVALVPAAFWLGERVSEAYPTSAVEPSSSVAEVRPAPVAQESTQSSPVDEETTYDVVVTVDPPRAEIWLDGNKVGHGSFETRFERDGAAHELHVLADGFVPARVWFADTAPAAHMRLEPVPALPDDPAETAPNSARTSAKRKMTLRKARTATAPAGLTHAMDHAGTGSMSDRVSGDDMSDPQRVSRARVGGSDAPRIQVIE